MAQEVQTEEGDYILVNEARAPEGDLGASATLPMTASVFDKADIVRKPGQAGAAAAGTPAAATPTKRSTVRPTEKQVRRLLVDELLNAVHVRLARRFPSGAACVRLTYYIYGSYRSVRLQSQRLHASIAAAPAGVHRDASGGRAVVVAEVTPDVTAVIERLELVLRHGFHQARPTLFGPQERPVSFWSTVLAPMLPKADVAFIESLDGAVGDSGRVQAWIRYALNQQSLRNHPERGPPPAYTLDEVLTALADACRTRTFARYQTGVVMIWPCSQDTKADGDDPHRRALPRSDPFSVDSPSDVDMHEFSRYRPDALLRDGELCAIVSTILHGLEAYWFRYA